jgi:cardiolipin synthase
VNLELLIDAAEVWPRVAADLAGARRRALVQLLTFEADAAGRPLGAALAACRAVDRRVVVDDFNRMMHNDRFLWSPRALLDRALRSEARGTRAMLAELAVAGVAVRRTNPVGPLLVRFPARNHKKIVVVDDVA